MARGAAGGDLDRLEELEISFSEILHVIEEHAAGIERDAAFDGFTNRARLLVNFLEHEMFEAALFRLNRIPGDALPLRLNGISVEVRHAHAVFCHHRDRRVGKECRSRWSPYH